jgi:hypothetical protein
VTAREIADGLARTAAAWPAGLAALPEPERERLADCIRPESIREAFEAARRSRTGPAGEEAKRRLRLLIPAYLAEAATDLRRGFSGGHGLAPEGRARRLAEASWAPEPAVRARAFGDLVEDAVRRRDFETERRAAFDRAAARAGASDARGLLDATAPAPPGAFLDRVEREAIAPLDEAVGRGAVLRRRRSPWCSGDRPLPMEEPFLERLGDRAGLYPGAVVRAAVREVARAIGDGGSVPDAEAHGGPGGLLLAFRALGSGLHAAISVRLGVHPGADPAFGCAWRELFARVAARAKGLDRLVPALDEESRRDVAFEIALVPRRMWARGSGSIPWEPAQILREERASGRPTAAACRTPNPRAPIERSAPLRGTLLALHLEERLLSRFGYAFWEARGARRLLEEIGEAERGETAESVAAALGAGTMDASPILDAYRP